MLGLNTGINLKFGDSFFEVLVADFVKLCAGDGVRRVGDNTKLHRNRNGGILMVAGNHNRGDTGGFTFDDSVLDLGAYRVNHAGKTDKDKVIFERFGSEVGRSSIIFLHRNGKHTKRLVCHSLVVLERSGFDFFGERNNLSVNESVRAFSENDVGCAFGILNEAVVRLMNGGHHLSA